MTATVVEGLKRLVRRDSGRVVYECRHCGTTVEHGTDRCPTCGAAEIARYEIR